MPRINKTEQGIINLMDGYAICLTKILKLDMQVFEAIETLNGEIKGELEERFPQFDTEVLEDNDALEYEGLRYCILSLYICGGIDKHLKEGMDSRNAWLSFSAEGQRQREKISVLNDIANMLLESFNLIPSLVTILESKDGLQLGQLVRLFNLVERPLSPIIVFNTFCSEGYFSIKSKSKSEEEPEDEPKGEPEDSEVAIYRLITEAEFIDIIEESYNKVADGMAIFDSSSNLVRINKVSYTQTTALLFPSLTEEQTHNSEYVDHLEKQLHLMITRNLRKTAPKKIDPFTSTHGFLKYGFPKDNYQRSLVTHKGSIIGLFGAIYAEMFRKVKKLCVKAAIMSADEIIKDLGFKISEKTIYRIRKENLNHFKVDKSMKVRTDYQQL